MQANSRFAGRHFFWAVLIFGLSVGPALANDQECPALPDRPGVLQPAVPQNARTLNPYAITRMTENYYDAPLGLGFLEVKGELDRHYYDWMFEVEVPLWSAANESESLGWLIGGRLYTTQGVVGLAGDGMVETEYEHTSFIVWETMADWVRLRLGNDRYAWTHRCHLHSDRFQLSPVMWEEFLRRHGDWLHFRRPVPHNLRAMPDVGSSKVTTIGTDHKLQLLDIRGDWMQVEVEQPDLTCDGLDGDESGATRHRGWVKWRDADGPWVYIYTRGC